MKTKFVSINIVLRLYNSQKEGLKKIEHEPDICIDIYEIEELPKFCKSLIARFTTNNNT